MRRTNNKVQSFPSPDLDTSSLPSNKFDQSFAPKLDNLHQLQGCRISADHLSKILDASIVAQKMGMNAVNAFSPTTGRNSDWKFINCYLESTVLLLDACNSIQLRLESIRSCLDMIAIGLHYLEGEHEPSRVVLQRAAAALESSGFRDKQHCSEMEKSMSKMPSFGKKLGENKLAYQDSSNSISPELYKALNGSWPMAVLAIGVLSSATSFRSMTSPCVQPPKAEPWITLLDELNNKIMVFPKKPNEIASMEGLASADLAIQALLKLISAWQMGGSCSLWRMAVKAIAGELKRRKVELEKTLPLLEEKIGELYKQIAALRISMLGLLSKVQKAEVLEMVKPSSYDYQ